MPKTILKYKILIASPGDVGDEREAIESVIKELNLTYGSRSNLVIELIKWETHTAPAVGLTNSTQNIVDNDLGIDYDLFIGILWKKFGTPNDQFASGTEQEYRRAYDRYKENPRSLQILFYFKTTSPPSLNSIDPNELKKVNEFKKYIGDKGVYYWEYNTIEEFQRFLRTHIPKRLEDLDKPINSDTDIRIEDQQDLSSTINVLEDELGVMDYTDMIEEYISYATQAVIRIAEATTWIGSEISKKADELTKMQSGGKQIGNKALRDFFNHSASIMDDFANRIALETPIFKSNFEKGIDGLSKLINIYHTDSNGIWNNQLEDASSAIDTLINDISIGLQGMKSFLEVINNFPRIEKELNRARSNVEYSLIEVVNSLEVSYNISIEIQKNLST